MNGDNQPLDPDDAASLFLSGEPMLYLARPADNPFVYGRYFGLPVSISALPFDPPGYDEASAYFSLNPVIQASAYRPPAPGVAVTALVRVQGAGWSVKGTNMAVALQLGQSVGLTVNFVDINGMPTTEPGPVTWTTSDSTQVSVLANTTDDTQATATSVAEGSQATITATSGGISANIVISVGAGPAAAASITAGTPFPTPSASAAHAKR